MFAISSNGELRLLSSLDYELSRLHSLVVRASDNYSSSGEPYNTMVSVIVTVVDRNDNRPTFEHDHYYVTISEDTSNTTILKVGGILVNFCVLSFDPSCIFLVVS